MFANLYITDTDMKIESVEFYRLKAFSFIEVIKLTIDFTNIVNVIMGDNGSGKSSLLRELNPLPANRQNYDTNGYKIIKVSHQGSSYVLSSKFENRTSPHSFIKDDEELNPGGTSGVQEELVNEHLGYTPLVHDVLMGNFKFSSMVQSTRRNLLIGVNPFQLKFILDKHKAISSKLRACKDNLSMLYERKSSLESVMLEISAKMILRDESSQLNTDIANIVESIHKLKAHINHTKIPSIVECDIDQIKRDYLATQKNSVNWKHISRDVDIESIIKHSYDCLLMTKNSITSHNKNIQAILTELDRYQTFVSNSNTASMMSELESRITEVRHELSTITSVIEDPFDSSMMNTVRTHTQHLNDILNHFVGYKGLILPSKDIDNLRQKFSQYNQQLSSYKHRQQLSSSTMAELNKQIELKTFDIPTNCQQSLCSLYNNYKTSLDSAQSQYDQHQRDYQVLEHKIDLVQKALDILRDRLSSIDHILPHMYRVSEYLNKHNFLRSALHQIDLITVLRTQPFLITTKIKQHYEDSLQFYRHKQLTEELHKLTTEYDVESASSSKQFIGSMIQDKNSELELLRYQVAGLETDARITHDYIVELEQYKGSLDHLGNCTTILHDYGNLQFIKFDIEQCQLMISELEHVKVGMVNRLTEINHILREQDLLEARYNDEVVANIEKLEVLKKDYAEIERALSPNTGIPHKYMVNFINALIKNANIFIGMVFSYPFEINTIDENKPVDFEFSAKVGGVHVPKLSMCSSAQRDIIDFAFSVMSLIVQLKLTDYPVLIDELGNTFDYHHKQKILTLMRTIVDDHLVSQLFLINHDAIIHNGMNDADFVVLNDNNIMLPSIYNEHVKIEK